MKKSYFLSAIFVLMSGACVLEMEPADNAHPREFNMIDMALTNNDWPAIFNLLDQTPSLVDSYENPKGFTLLYIAVVFDQFALAQTLLERYGANPNRGEFAPAVLAGNIPMMKLLLKYGANPDLPIKSGITARKFALMKGKQKPELLETIESFDRK